MNIKLASSPHHPRRLSPADLPMIHRLKGVLPACALVILLAVTACALSPTANPTQLPALTVAGQTPTPVPTARLEQIPGFSQYSNRAFGLRFQYPAGWFGPDEYVSGNTLRVAVGSDVVHPYGEPSETPSAVKNSYLVVVQYSKNSQDASWQDTYSALAGLKDGESLSGTRSLITRVRQLELAGMKGFEFISTLSATAQTEPVYSREVLLVDQQSNLLTILGNPDNVEVGDAAGWREAYRLVDQANLAAFHQILATVEIE
jgi:hypothetical protein